MIADKSKIIYSLEKSVKKLEQDIEISKRNNNKNDNDVYSSLGTTLLWIGSCLDRLKNNVTFEDDEHEYKQAFRGAYNAQKHSVILFSFHRFKKGGVSSPFQFPLSIPESNYYFSKLDDNAIKNKEQIQKYNDILSDKPIILEIKKIQQIINKKFTNL